MKKAVITLAALLCFGITAGVFVPSDLSVNADTGVTHMWNWESNWKNDENATGSFTQLTGGTQGACELSGDYADQGSKSLKLAGKQYSGGAYIYRFADLLLPEAGDYIRFRVYVPADSTTDRIRLGINGTEKSGIGLAFKDNDDTKGQWRTFTYQIPSGEGTISSLDIRVYCDSGDSNNEQKRVLYIDSYYISKDKAFRPDPIVQHFYTADSTTAYGFSSSASGVDPKPAWFDGEIGGSSHAVLLSDGTYTYAGNTYCRYQIPPSWATLNAGDTVTFRMYQASTVPQGTFRKVYQVNIIDHSNSSTFRKGYGTNNPFDGQNDQWVDLSITAGSNYSNFALEYLYGGTGGNNVLYLDSITIVRGGDFVDVPGAYDSADGAQAQVSLEPQGGEAIDPQYVLLGETAALPSPVKSKSTFIGWYKESSCETEWNASDTVTEDITLYAKWMDNLVLLNNVDSYLLKKGWINDDAEAFYLGKNVDIKVLLTLKESLLP